MDNQNPIMNARQALVASLAAAAEAAHLPLNLAHLMQVVDGVDVSELFMTFAGQANRAFVLPPPPPPPPAVPQQGLPHVPFGHPFPELHLPPHPAHLMQTLRALTSVPNSDWDFNFRGCVIFFDLIGRWTDVNGRQILWAKVAGEIWYRHLKKVDGQDLKKFFLNLIRRPLEPRIINNGPGNFFAVDTEVHQFFVVTANAMWQARSEGQDFTVAWPAHWAALL